MENKLPPLRRKCLNICVNPTFSFVDSSRRVGDVQVGEVDSRLQAFKSWLLFSKERLSIFRRREALIKCALLREELYV